MESAILALKKFLPCIIGAFLAAMTGEERSHWIRFIGFISGSAMAIYFTDPALIFFQLDHNSYSAPMGFSLGYFGMSIAEAFIKAIRELDVAGIIKGWLGK